MEPIPETVEALRELTRHGDDTLARTLWQITRSVEEVVPEVVGVSLSLSVEQLTFTMTSTGLPADALDAVQYLDGGPCEEAMRSNETRAFRSDDPVDEERWGWFARATAAQGVESTLSLPILRDGAVIAGVNLYAGRAHAFETHCEELAEVCGAWAGGVVRNADLGFSTRLEAAAAPDRLRSQLLVDQALGALMARCSLELEDAERRLVESARRAGLTEAEVARIIVELARWPTSGEADDDGEDAGG